MLPEAPKHGARYTIEDLRIEIRAIRNRGKWLSAETNRDDTAVETELEKDGKLKNIFPLGCKHSIPSYCPHTTYILLLDFSYLDFHWGKWGKIYRDKYKRE